MDEDKKEVKEEKKSKPKKVKTLADKPAHLLTHAEKLKILKEGL